MKPLSVAVDFYDDILEAGQFPDKDQIAALMAYVRELGAESVDWIYDDMWAIYDAYPGGFDLLRAAVDSAHAEGLRFHAVYKPFEGGLAHLILPPGMPRPTETPVWEDLDGILPIVRPFIARHLEFCFKRMPGDADPGGAVAAIRLFKNDDAPVTLKASDVTLWTGTANGRFERVPGRFTLDTHTAFRPVFPLGRTCRVVTLAGLEIPAGERYLEVRFAEGAFDGQPFSNEYHDLAELVRADGTVVPSTTAAAAPPGDHYVRHFAKPVMSRLIRYGHRPEVQAFLADEEAIRAHAAEMRAYVRAPAEKDRVIHVHERRLISIARGKPPFLFPHLNPVYPEVRQEWLRTLSRLLASGADAIDIRVSSHANPQDRWAYGFNEPVLAALGGEANLAGAARVIGSAFTAFLREARDRVHAQGRKLGVHLMTSFLVPRDEGLAHPLQEGMDYDWETWIREIADFAVLRGAMGLRAETLRYAVDRFGSACREAGVPMTYQSNRRYFAGLKDRLNLPSDRLSGLEHEMSLMLAHPCVSRYQLYETAYMTRLGPDGMMRGNRQLVDLCRKIGFIRSLSGDIVEP